MADNGGTGVSVSVVENAHTDPCTVAYSALDVAQEAYDRSDDEITRMQAKQDRAADEAKLAKQYVADAKQTKADRKAALDDAGRELAAVRAAHPEHAAAADERRESARVARIDELTAELARLRKG